MTAADRERYGRAAYEAYGDSVGWVVFSGAPMPQWDETLERIREAWRAAGQKVADTVRAELVAAAPGDCHLEARIHEATRLGISPSRFDGQGTRPTRAEEEAIEPVTFTINGTPVTMTPRPLSYVEIARLAGIDPERESAVTYRHAAGQKTTSEGSLFRGQWLAVAEGTVINCIVTGNA